MPASSGARNGRMLVAVHNFMVLDLIAAASGT